MRKTKSDIKNSTYENENETDALWDLKKKMRSVTNHWKSLKQILKQHTVLIYLRKMTQIVIGRKNMNVSSRHIWTNDDEQINFIFILILKE